MSFFDSKELTVFGSWAPPKEGVAVLCRRNDRLDPSKFYGAVAGKVAKKVVKKKKAKKSGRR